MSRDQERTRLRAQIRQAEEDEERYADEYRALYSGGLWSRLVNSRRIGEYAERANECQRKVRSLREQLCELDERVGE